MSVTQSDHRQEILDMKPDITGPSQGPHVVVAMEKAMARRRDWGLAKMSAHVLEVCFTKKGQVELKSYEEGQNEILLSDYGNRTGSCGASKESEYH